MSEALEQEIEKLKHANQISNKLISILIVTNQSAWIEWKYGKGAKAAMQWIENSLRGPGNIPTSETSKYCKDAQLFSMICSQTDSLTALAVILRQYCGWVTATAAKNIGRCIEKNSKMMQRKRVQIFSGI